MDIQALLREIIPFVSQYGLIIVFIGALLEGETVILLAGILCHRAILPFEEAVIVAAIGAFTGDQIWFYLGRRYGRRVITRFTNLTKHEDTVRLWLKHKSDTIAFGSRFIYGTRTVAPVLLGIYDYPALRFAIINSISASVWAAAGIGIGYLLGTGAEKIFGHIDYIEELMLLVILIMLAWWWYRYRKENCRSGKSR